MLMVLSRYLHQTYQLQHPDILSSLAHHIATLQTARTDL